MPDRDSDPQHARSEDLIIPRTATKFGARSFAVAAPSEWNRLSCRYTFVLSRRLTVLKSHWSLSSSPLTAPNWYVPRQCMISLGQVISHALRRALVMILSCYGALQIVCVLLLLFYGCEWHWHSILLALCINCFLSAYIVTLSSNHMHSSATVAEVSKPHQFLH